MNYLLSIIFLALVIHFAFEGYNFFTKLKIASDIATSTTKFENISSDLSKTILVMGDSTAYGTGAKSSENSIAGRIFKYTNATYLENISANGARINDLQAQLNAKKLESYNLILILIGGNDIIRFKSSKTAEKEFQEFLSQLLKYAKYDRLIIASAGNVGSTQIFPKVLNPFYENLNLQYHAMFEKVVGNLPNAVYVNFYEKKENDLFFLQPKIYLAPDGLHPSDEGYKLWAEKIIKAL